MEKIYKITWRDIAGGKNWMSESEALRWGKKQFKLEYYTVGYILYKDKDFLLIAGSFYEEDEETVYNDISMIPKSVIIKREQI